MTGQVAQVITAAVGFWHTDLDQLPAVGYLPTVAMTGNGELGFDSGEGARETATTSKEDSRRANYPILTQGGSDKK